MINNVTLWRLYIESDKAILVLKKKKNFFKVDQKIHLNQA